MHNQYQNLMDMFLRHLESYKTNLIGKKPKELYEPEDYILSLGGKRLRPLLALIACDLFDKDPNLSLHSALAVELFHNFSLIHDDILDAAPIRRNMPTVHKKWNNNIAILSGDVMLVKSFQSLENYGFKEYKKLSKIFNETAIEVCEGQQMDMNFETSDNVSVEDYIQMITLKTAVLLGCSLKMGGVNAYTSEENLNNIYEFGKHLGIAFQLLDDKLDTFSENLEKFGKQIGGDILASKKTFLLIKALELSDDKQKKELINYLELQPIEADKKIEGVLNIYNQLNIKKLCEQEADKHTNIAIDFLDKVEANSSKKDQLKMFALELLKRQV